MSTLVFLEAHDGSLTKGGLGVLAKAAALGGDDERTVVRDPASPTWPASAPMSASETTSCGFDFAPMIPLRDGYRGSLIASETATTAGSGTAITS